MLVMKKLKDNLGKIVREAQSLISARNITKENYYNAQVWKKLWNWDENKICQENSHNKQQNEYFTPVVVK